MDEADEGRDEAPPTQRVFAGTRGGQTFGVLRTGGT